MLMGMEHLNEKEKQALVRFKELLAQQFPVRFDEMKLFGSKARGDASKFSDIDVLVVIANAVWQDSWPIHQAANKVALEMDVDLSVKILDPNAVKRLRAKGSPLISNIDRERVVI